VLIDLSINLAGTLHFVHIGTHDEFKWMGREELAIVYEKKIGAH